MDIVTLCVLGIALVAAFYNNWIPQVMGWVDDRVHS
jgi:hypothetical protein